MILRTLLIALRHALRFKTYSLINLGGLGLAIGAALIIVQFVTDEFSYDQFHHHAHNVYRLNTATQRPGGIEVRAAATPLLAPTLMSDMPEVEAAVRLRHADDVLVEVGEQKFYETNVFYADYNFFKVLTFPLAKGDPNTSLSRINTAVITADFAKKYFGAADPINKTISVSNRLLQITGVIGPGAKSHFYFDILISFETFTPPIGTPAILSSWEWTSFPTYVRLRDGVNLSAVQAKFPAFIARYRSAEDAKRISYQLQPINDVYLHSRNILERDGIAARGDYYYTMGLAAIAGLIMAIACFNFANLSTALSIYRVKEAGVKRSLGSSRRDIFFQHILEAVFMATVGLVIGISLHLIVSMLELMPGTSLSAAMAVHLKWVPFYGMLVLTVGTVAGLYPAVLLSGLSAQQALKGKGSLSRSGRVPLRKAVIVFQFFVTTVLIAASLLIQRQMDFVQAKSLGYDKGGVVVLHLPDADMRRNYTTLKNRFTQHASVAGVSACRDLFDGQQGITDVTDTGHPEESHVMNMFRTYPGFIETMGIKMLRGRSFHEPLADSTSFVLNEAAVEVLGWKPDEALGRKVHAYFQTGEVIGVTENFNFASLHTAVTPLIILIPKSKVEYLYVRVAPGDMRKSIAAIEDDWKAVVPGLPFDFVMLDEHIDSMYRQEERFSQLTFVFCGLSVLLASLGLFGITALITESRIKEIGIRKVLGASASRIAAWLAKDFLFLVLIASVIAVPAASYLLGRWLQGFAYKVDITVGLLIGSVLLSLTLAAVAVGFKTVSAARANPVDSLRSE